MILSGDYMNNKKIAIIVSVFILVLFILIGFMGIMGKIPLLGKPIAFITSIIIILFVLGFITVIAKRRK